MDSNTNSRDQSAATLRSLLAMSEGGDAFDRVTVKVLQEHAQRLEVLEAAQAGTEIAMLKQEIREAHAALTELSHVEESQMPAEESKPLAQRIREHHEGEWGLANILIRCALRRPTR